MVRDIIVFDFVLGNIVFVTSLFAVVNFVDFKILILFNQRESIDMQGR